MYFNYKLLTVDSAQKIYVLYEKLDEVEGNKHLIAKPCIMSIPVYCIIVRVIYSFIIYVNLYYIVI